MFWTNQKVSDQGLQCRQKFYKIKLFPRDKQISQNLKKEMFLTERVTTSQGVEIFSNFTVNNTAISLSIGTPKMNNYPFSQIQN